MSDNNLDATNRTMKSAGCGCAKAAAARECPCKGRLCLPILGLVGIAVVVSMAAKRRQRK